MIQNAHEGLQPDRCRVLLGHDEIMLQFFKGRTYYTFRARRLPSSQEYISKQYSLPRNRTDRIARQEFNLRQFFGMLTEIIQFCGFCLLDPPKQLVSK